ncbi:hypothetical protein LI292_10650 [Blautia obeum]|uniref:hypothetical protein n=1 Tax=Blautia obeum TaxID=40520 RepID=UPI0015F3281D|nr:hypothetical protein [Blautia obeum]MCB6333540.1 hypothetical protein [Blautia obeum]MCQ5356659.1 hypothetical protein [Blautia obeum]
MRFIKEITLFTPSGTLKRFQGLETSFKVEQGKISALISESELTELRNGDKTMYSRLYSAEQTVSGLEKLYTDVTGKYDAVSKQYTSLDTKVGEYKSAVDGFSGDLQQLSTTINDNYSTTKSMQTYVKAQVDGLSTVVSETYVKTDTLSEYSTTEQTKSMIDQKTDQIKLDVREKIYGTNYCKNGTFETFTGWVAYLDKKPCITYLGKTCAYLVSGNSIWMNYDYTVDADESNTIIFEAASPEKVALNIKIDDTTIKTFYSSEMSKEWKEFSVDVKLKKGKHTIQFVTSSNASVLYVTNVQIKQDIIESTHSQINIIQSSIESKVSKNGIISSINQSSEKVSISAGKINFNGLVTANNYFQILTGGSFVAAYGTLGGWTVKDGIMKSNDQKIVLDPVNNKIYFDDGDDDFVTELSPDGTRTNFLTVDGGIVGGDAALLISAASSSRIQFYDSFSDDGEDEIKLQGNLEVRGTKSRVARTENFSDRLLYCYETPTPMFGDLGCGKTNDRGIAIVDIDPAFSETINSGIEYQVFLQKEGDGDIWIAEKDTEFFMVRGTPNLKFSWELKCIQKNFEHLRLDEKEVQEAAQKDARDTQKDYNIIIDTVVEDYDKEMEELINESN